ncbi:MAG: hypothetical protein PVSMB4_16320 [Ktedonobacterales bacterium]
MISALGTKVGGVEAHRTYQQNASNQLWKQHTDLATQAAEALAQALKRLAQSGQLHLGQPGQASSVETETCTSPVS